MDQEKAKVLFREGATLVIEDVPEGTEFGIDYNSWTTGPKFKGVKMIPPGIHFIYYSSCSKCGDKAPRAGFYYDFKPRQMVHRKWDLQNEDMKEVMTSEDDLNRLAENKEDIDQYLGAYPYENYKKWVSWSNHISWDLLMQLQPKSGRIAAVTEFISECSTSKSRKLDKPAQIEVPKTMAEAESRLPIMSIEKNTVIHFTEIPKIHYPENCTPDVITKYSMDSSFILNKLIKESYNGDYKLILGELQFAFICFLIGQVYEGFEQWKRLIHVLCTSEEGLQEHRDLFLDLIVMLHFQVTEIPDDFFVDIVSANNFLTTTLHILFSNIENPDVDSKLKKRGLHFKEHLTNKFKWDFGEDPEEFAPVVVDLPS